MEGERGAVCVTGGTGYIGSWLIMRLLELGYSVNATVRFDPECKRDISYLTNLPGASERLQIFNADLNEPNSFSAAIEGCTVVFHLAHPIDHSESQPEEAETKKAVEGTLGILKACLNSKTVKRIVYTASGATVMFNHKDQGVTDETTWTDVDFYRSLNIRSTSYLIAKTKTERAAWEFAEQHGLDLVSLIPPLVVGPFICPNIPSSVNMALAMILGKLECFRGLINSNLVHVDDVASALIFLFEFPNAKGRYICCSNAMTKYELCEFLSAKYPEFQIRTADILKIESYEVPRISSKKLLDSGFKFKYGLDEMFDGAILCAKEKGFL
ncbi:unnamed protein product [Ilex paraguariensis]|uniref:Dihydroflavonol 4-reductase n=1 Tax=Ilex paraguariensis TaxID=185542 RepID=A0ABC8UZM5_9AQUA